MGPEIAAGLVLAGCVLTLAAVGIGFALRGPAVKLAEAQRDDALADLAAEKAAHAELAGAIQAYGRAESRRRGLADDLRGDPLELTRRLLQPGDGDALPPAGSPEV